MLRTGVVAVLALGSLAVTATPALANSDVTIDSASPNIVSAGQTVTLQYTVRSDPDPRVIISVDSGDLTCLDGCGSQESFNPVQQEKHFTAHLKAPNNLAPGSNKIVNVTVTSNGEGRDGEASAQITLRGPDKPDTVKSVSGRVVNLTNGKGIPDAAVALDDGEHRYDTHTDRDGDFTFTSSDDAPISPGRILLGAGKEGFENKQTSTNVSAGQAKSGLRITLKPKAAPSPSASDEPSPTPEESAEDLPTEVASIEDSIEPEAAGNNSSDSGGGGLFSWVLIILGGLLVALGVGAIVLLLVRRKDTGEDGTGDPLPDPDGPRPTPGAQGVYHGAGPTMVAGGGPMGGGPTMPMRPGLAEAPTMMHRPVDEYGDPYGTPLRAPQPTSGPGGPGGLGGPGGPGGPDPGYGYQGGNQGGYGPGGSPMTPMSGSPGGPAGYGSASQTAYGGAAGRASASVSPPDPYAPRDRDYGTPAPYDEPTGRYDRNGGGYGYGQPTNGHEREYGPGPSNGYGQDAGYDPGAGNGYGGSGSGYGGSGNGYDRAGNGYEPPGGGYDGGRYDGGRYEPPPGGYGPQGGYDDYGQPGGQPSYDQGGGYDQGGYDQQAGYERTPEPRGGGYDQRQRGYDQGYYDEPTSRSDRPSRRSLDWLDD